MTMPVYGSWGGDPGHTGAKPMMSLQGGCSEVHTQEPMEGTNTGPARGMPEATSGNIDGWVKSLANTGGAHDHTVDDARTKST